MKLKLVKIILNRNVSAKFAVKLNSIVITGGNKKFNLSRGEVMFWKKKKQSCNHTWYHLQDTFISNNVGGVIDNDDGCYIFCPWCKSEKLVYRDEWERIEKKQEITQELNKSIYE
jgi:hypothetical protein